MHQSCVIRVFYCGIIIGYHRYTRTVGFYYHKIILHYFAFAVATQGLAEQHSPCEGDCVVLQSLELKPESAGGFVQNRWAMGCKMNQNEMYSTSPSHASVFACNYLA